MFSNEVLKRNLEGFRDFALLMRLTSNIHFKVNSIRSTAGTAKDL